MPEVLFPDKWWKLSQEEYIEAKTALKGLIAKDPDSGNAEVIIRVSTKGAQGCRREDHVSYASSNFDLLIS